jgi:hypothetical protein
VSQEQFSHISHCVYQTYNNLALWWIDDCFNNPTQDGGYLPISVIKQKRVKPNLYGNSGDIYEMLERITQEENISFYVCSFEYAQENWSKLNSYNNLLLIDIGYEGQVEEDVYGLDFMLQMSQQSSILATFTFFTIDPSRVTQWIISRGQWLPHLSIPISKSRQSLTDSFAMLPEPEIRSLIRCFTQHYARQVQPEAV